MIAPPRGARSRRVAIDAVDKGRQLPRASTRTHHNSRVSNHHHSNDDAMAAPPRLASLASVLVVSGLVLLSSIPSHASPIRVELYMETLCPYCANATLQQVSPIVHHPVLGQAVSVAYIPWGNARAAERNGTVCQHGPTECALNSLLSCAIALYPTNWFDFAVCLEETVLAARQGGGGGKAPPPDLSVAAVAARCAQPPAQPPRLVACAEGPLGRALTRMAAERTAALVPKHQYVPWFVVNGVALKSASDDLLAFVCVALDPSRRALTADVCGDPVPDDHDDEDTEDKAGRLKVSVGGASGGRAEVVAAAGAAEPLQGLPAWSRRRMRRAVAVV